MTYALSRDADILMGCPNICYVAIIPISGAKVPAPLFNIGQLDTAKTSIKNVKIKSLPVVVLTDEIPLTTADEMSLPFGGGLLSGKSSGKASWMLGSTCVFMKGKPALSMPLMALPNANNVQGVLLSVKQKVVQIRR